MSLISVFWSGTHEEDEDFSSPFAKKHEILLGPWADCEENGDAAAKEICEHFIDDDFWREYIGNDDTSAAVLIQIHTPQSIAGTYLVDLDRVVKATARKREIA